MGGTQCADFRGVDIGATGLCLIPDGEHYEGLITYHDGRTASIVSSDEDSVTLRSAAGANFTVPIIDLSDATLVKKMNDQLYYIKSGPNAGAITYADGRVATISAPAAGEILPAGVLRFVNPAGGSPIRSVGLSETDITRTRALQNVLVFVTADSPTRAMAGSEIGNCGAQGPLASNIYRPLWTSLRGAAISWSNDDYLELRRIMGLRDTDSGYAFLCADAPNADRIVVGTDPMHAGSAVSALRSLESSCGSLDAAHCEAMKESLRVATGTPPPPESHDLDLLKVGLAFLGVHILGSGTFLGIPLKEIPGRIVGGGASLVRGIFNFIRHPIRTVRNAWQGIKDFFNKQPPQDPPPPGGGGGGSEDATVRTVLTTLGALGLLPRPTTSTAPATTPATAPAPGSGSSSMVALDPELTAGLSVLGESDALVPNGPDTGARTYVTLDGVSVEGTTTPARPGMAPLGGPGAVPRPVTVTVPNVRAVLEGLMRPGMRLSFRFR